MIQTVQGVIIDGSTPLTAAPSSSPLTVPMGNDMTVVVPMVGSNGNPLPLAGYAAPTLTVKVTPTSTGSITTSTGTISGSAITFQVSGAALKTAGPGAYHWDVFLTNPQGLRDEVVLDSQITVVAADGA